MGGPGAAAQVSGSEPLVEPVFLPSVGHGPQGGVFCRVAPPKDDPVVQAVGLALPEFYYQWVYNVATPTKRSRGLGALCIFLSMLPPLPLPPLGPSQEVAGMCLMRVDRE